MTWSTIEAMTMDLVKAQDRQGARTLRALLTEVGRTDPAYQAEVAAAASMDLSTVVDMGHPTEVQALASALATCEGEPLCSCNVGDGLRAIGIYHRTIEPVPPVAQRRRG